MQKFLQKHFIFILFTITVFGFSLRFYQFDVVPKFLETEDEIMYPWGGMSFFTTGTPTSWSFSPSYTDVKYQEYWGKTFRLVSPWIEKPPLYSLITGAFVLLAGQRDFEDIKIETLRIIPLILGTVSIFLIGLLGKSYFSFQVGYLSAVLYATIPTIVISSRLSLTENLLTPIVLLTLWFVTNDFAPHKKWRAFLVGMLCALAINTRQLGLALPISVIFVFLTRKQWTSLIITSAVSIFSLGVQPAIGAFYDVKLYLSVVKDYKNLFAQGLPGSIANIFRFPMITYTFNPFIDGSILAGFIALFSSPLWLKLKENSTLIAFPFVYLVLLSLFQSEESIFGWHLFPLFPFLVLLLAKIFYDFWQKPNVFLGISLFLIIGMSSYRFLVILMPDILHFWQRLLAVILALFFAGFFIKDDLSKKFVFAVFLIYLIINSLIVIGFQKVYPF